MSKVYRPFKTVLAGCALFLICGSPIIVRAQDQSPASATAPDNSAQNKDHATTADQQSANKSDREITREIRRAVVSDKSLSTYAHNVKIITRNGAVLLKGPVHSDEEKEAVLSKAADVVGRDKVTDQLTVKQ